MMHGYGMGGAGWIVMMIVWAVLLLVIVAVVVRIFPKRTGDASAPPAASAAPVVTAARPLEILDRRLASGEITLETYDRLRERLVEAGRGR